MELNKGKKIILLSSGQPSLNPRLVKEADALAGAGYAVTVLYAYWNDWGTRYDEQMLNEKRWTAIRVAGDPDQRKLTFILSRFLFKFGRSRLNIFGRDAFAARSTWFLIRESKKHPADLYIAHNLGALPAAFKAAKKYGRSYGFDAEDFHRNELSDDQDNPLVKLATRLEEKYIPQADYLTASSPLIAEAYRKLFPGKNPAVILNVFPADLNVCEPAINRDGPLKLFWFSQTIGPNRGLENVISTMQNLREYPIELHLLGDRQNNFLPARHDLKVYFHSPVPPGEIPYFASRFDIGLAVENSIPHNRDICLTNKIFTYMQAGLAILATDTRAQAELMGEHPDIGTVYRQNDIGALTGILLDYHLNREKLLAARKASFSLARTTFNWETEQEKSLGIIADTLNKQ